MALVTLNEVSIGFRGPTLFDDVSCRIEEGQRIGLLGRNGAGKTTLMRMILGETQPDAGNVVVAAGKTVALLQQDVPRDWKGSVQQIVLQGVSVPQNDAKTDTGDWDNSDWESEHKTEQILSRMGLDGSAAFETLSSGMKRRVLLARALVNSPDLLLLDEPTNHLDMDAIDWLENFLSRWNATLMFVTHDRMFLRRLATRILEIDRGHLFDWSCDYDTFLKRKEEALDAEEKQAALFDKKLAIEETWIRQGIKARRTRNEGRVRALKKMREEFQQRRKKIGQVGLRIQEGQRSGNLVAGIEKVNFSYDDRPIVKDFSTTIMRGDKVGIIGPNGVGKTTLLRILLGQLEPHSGSVKLGTNLQIAYFDQLRQQLDEQETVQHNVADGYENININGRSQHIIGYLQNFLFSPERARTPVRFLSGGERNRVLLAKLFAKPANIIVLDEPTNDLDTETLELLENRLVEFSGTVLLVSHDRVFLNNVVTSTIAFEEDGPREYVGGYDDWLRQRPQIEKKSAKAQPEASKPKATPGGSSTAKVAKPNKRLTHKEKKELKALPGLIEKLETDIAALHTAMGEPGFYKQPGDIIAEEQGKLAKFEADLAAAYRRWEELE